MTEKSRRIKRHIHQNQRKEDIKKRKGNTLADRKDLYSHWKPEGTSFPQ